MDAGALLRSIAVATLSFGIARAQPDSFIITARPTKPVLNSLHVLPDATVLYADAYGVYRARGQQLETLLTNPSHEAYCKGWLFGGCLLWVPAEYHPKPMAADSGGTIFIADPERHVIQRYDSGLKAFVTVAENAGSPTSLAVGGDGSLYFNDPDGCRVRRLSQGAVTTVAGTGTCGYSNDGGPATTAQILSVRAIAFDSLGQLYIADDRAGVVRRVDTAGIIMTIVGTGYPGQGGEGTPANRTPLNGPAALAIDAQGNLYIAEASSNRVRMVGADGLIRTIAGTGIRGHAGDYGLAASAQLASPECLAVAPDGALHICDWDRIRRLIPPAPGRWVLPVLKPGFVIPQSRFGRGSWLSLLGDFAEVPTTDWGSAIGADGSLPTSLGGVAARVGGRPCIVAYVSPDWIDLLLPADLDPDWHTLELTLPGAKSTFSMLIAASSPEFLMRIANGKLYPAALTQDGVWITPDQPARPGQTIMLYVTGLGISGPTVPPYDVSLPNGMQVVLRSYGYPVLLARPFSLGVFELTVQLPADLPAGDLPVRVVTGFMSNASTYLPVGRVN